MATFAKKKLTAKFEESYFWKAKIRFHLVCVFSLGVTAFTMFHIFLILRQRAIFLRLVSTFLSVNLYEGLIKQTSF